MAIRRPLRRYLKKETVFSIVALAFGISLIFLTNETESEKKSKSLFLPPPPAIEQFASGYREVFADAIWLRLIQDADHCDQPTQTNQPCRTEKGWVFLMVDAITKLAPRFMAPYSHGATILSVLVGDYKGAQLIFERGLEAFPNDWQLQYRAAFHAMDRLGDFNQAAHLLLQAAKNGAPAWVYALSAKLYTQEGRAVFAKTILEDVLKSETLDSRWSQRLRTRLEEIDQSLKEQK